MATQALTVGGPTPERSHLETLRRVTRDMAASTDLPVLLDSIVRTLVEHTGATVARIFLDLADEECAICRDGDHQSIASSEGKRALHLMANAGPLQGPRGPHHVVPYDVHSVLARVGVSRQPLLTNDLVGARRPDDHPEQARSQSLLNLTAAGAIPLEFRGELLGVIGMLSVAPFEPLAFDLLRVFADQAATAIKNAYLFAELQRYKDRLQVENAYLRDELGAEREFTEIVGGSPALGTVIRKIKQVGAVETTVLLTGETGTGKELVARAIHKLSERRARPMIKMNCGAIPQGVVESELFGHEKGAFTGALQRRVGRFELADRSTLFMDEVGELTLDTQVKLLRILQEQEFERVGGSRPIKVDVRLVAATNRDLEHEVGEGRFRADLFYRLNVFPIHIPPLRERPTDVPILVAHFLEHFQRKLGKRLRAVTAESMERLTSYPWPGNIRELQNVIERACVLTTSPVVDVTLALRSADQETAIPMAREPLVTLEEHERRHVQRALARAKGRVHGPGGAADLLGLNASTLRSRMEKLGIRKADH